MSHNIENNGLVNSLLEEIRRLNQHIQDLAIEISTLKTDINALKAQQHLFVNFLNSHSIRRFDWGEEDTIDSGINKKKTFKPGPY